MGKGFISIWRKIREHWVYSDSFMLHLWIELLVLANYKDNKFLLGRDVVEVQEGDVITSIRKLATTLNCSEKKILTGLKTFEKDGMIIKHKSHKRTHLTICNYAPYQDIGIQKDKEKHLKRNSEDTVRTTINHSNHSNHSKKEEKQEENVSGIPCDLSVDCEGSYTLNDVPEPPKPETIDQTHIDRYNEIWETHFTEGKITQRANAFSLIAGYKIYLAEMATDEKYKTIEHFLLIVKEAVIKVNDIGKLNGKDNFKGFVQSPVRLLTKGRDGAFWLARVLTNEFDKGDTNGNLKPKHSIPEGKKYDVDPDDDWGAAKIYK